MFAAAGHLRWKRESRNLLCDFIKDGDNRFRCKRCGRIVAPSVPTKQVVAACRVKVYDANDGQGILPFPPASPTLRPRPTPEQLEAGPGYQLHKLLKQFIGEDITPGCGCTSRMAKMDCRGPAWCRENIDTIVDWLIEEADRRLKQGKEADEPASWRLRLGGLNLPGRRLLLRRLVLVAVRRAEREASAN